MLRQMLCPAGLMLTLPLSPRRLSCLPRVCGGSSLLGGGGPGQAGQRWPAPVGCPPNRLFVPSELRAQVIHWAHASALNCHPGVKRTLFAIKKRFWWPSMDIGVRKYVAACPAYAQSKVPRQPPAGLLRPLLVPSSPWSDIFLDLVTGLPSTEGYTTILLLTDSPRWYISFRWLNSCLPKRGQKLCYPMCSGCTYFPKISCQTGARNLFPSSGRPSVSK